MKKVLLGACLGFLFSLTAFAQGNVPLDEVVYFDFTTYNITTGGFLAATGTPTYEVFEEASDTPIVTGNCALRTSYTSEYRCTFTASAANGFELGKWYIVNGLATVGGTASSTRTMHFRIVAAEATAGIPEANVKTINAVSTAAVTTVKAVQGLTTADTIVTYTGNTPQTGDAFARLGAPVGASVSADILTQKNLTLIRANTAQAGSSTTITLDASASAVDNYYNNDMLLITSGTGAGQARFISAYVGSTKVATVGTWATTPNNTSVFAIEPFDAVAGATAPTVAQIRTGIWQDLLANSDFATASSIGKLLKDDIDAQLSSLAAVTDVRTIQKNVAFANYPIWMLSTTNAGVAGLLSGQITCLEQMDAGRWDVMSNVKTEAGGQGNGRGKYFMSLTQAQTDGNILSFECSANGAVTRRTDVTTQH